jgi:transposase-like protein
MTIRRELIDELLKDYDQPQDILGEGGLLKELTKAVIERCLETELDTHLGYPKHGRKGNTAGNVRNGHSQKTLKGEQGHVDIQVPRDRQGTFEPQLVKKGQTPLEGTDRENPGPGCTRHDYTRHPGPIARTLWRGGLAHPHFQCD